MLRSIKKLTASEKQLFPNETASSRGLEADSEEEG